MRWDKCRCSVCVSVIVYVFVCVCVCVSVRGRIYSKTITFPNKVNSVEEYLFVNSMA